MNLPLINTDTVGNSYYGWRINDLLYSPNSVGLTTAQLATWINNFFNQTCAVAPSATTLRVIFPTSFESLTLPATSAKYRFGEEYASTATTNFSVTSASRISYPTIANNNRTLYDSTYLAAGSSSRVFYGVLNNRSLNIFSIERNGPDLNNNDFCFVSFGWLNNSIYSGSAFPRNAYILILDSTTSRIQGFRPSAENSNVVRNFQIPQLPDADPIANYPVSCQSATPGANTTEFYLRDNVAPNKAIGYVPNLLKTSLQIPVGGVYRNTGIDPDLSDMNTWICVGVLGSERILMRVWTQGLA